MITMSEYICVKVDPRIQMQLFKMAEAEKEKTGDMVRRLLQEELDRHHLKKKTLKKAA